MNKFEILKEALCQARIFHAEQHNKASTNDDVIATAKKFAGFLQTESEPAKD